MPLDAHLVDALKEATGEDWFENIRLHSNAKLFSLTRADALVHSMHIYWKGDFNVTQHRDIFLLLHEIGHCRQYKEYGLRFYCWYAGSLITAMSYRKSYAELEADAFRDRFYKKLVDHMRSKSSRL